VASVKILADKAGSSALPGCLHVGPLEQRSLNNVTNYFYINIYSYLETSMACIINLWWL